METQLLRALEKTLLEEVKLHESYLELLVKEQTLVTKMQAEKVLETAAKRSDLSTRISEANQKRIELVEKLEPKTKRKLTDIVAEKCTQSERKLLLPILKRLRRTVETVHRKAKEFGQVVNFSLRMIDGSISIITSASRAGAKSYGADAKIRQSQLPKRSRSELTIKEA